MNTCKGSKSKKDTEKHINLRKVVHFSVGGKVKDFI